MIRRPPRSTRVRSSAASDVYKRQRIPPGQPGWVSVAVPYQPGWSLNGHPARSTPDGVVSVWAGASGGVLRYRPWTFAWAGDVISLVLVLILAVALVIGNAPEYESIRQLMD